MSEISSNEILTRRKSFAAEIRAELFVPNGLADSEKRPNAAVDRDP